VRIVIPTIEHGFIRSMYTKVRSQCIVKTNIIRGPFNRRNFYLHQTNMRFPLLSSAKKYSVWAELLISSGRAPSKPSETPRWQITPRPVSIQRDVLHIALRLLFHRFFALGRSPTLHYQSSVVTNSDYVSEWVHSVRAWFRVAIQWLTLRDFFLAFLLPVRKCNSLFTYHTHHSKSPDLCGYWQSIANSFHLPFYYYLLSSELCERSEQCFPRWKHATQQLLVLFSEVQISGRDPSYQSFQRLWWAPGLTSTQR